MVFFWLVLYEPAANNYFILPLGQDKQTQKRDMNLKKFTKIAVIMAIIAALVIILFGSPIGITHAAGVDNPPCPKRVFTASADNGNTGISKNIAVTRKGGVMEIP